MSDLQSSPVNEKPSVDALFPELKRSTRAPAPRFMADALAASSMLGRGLRPAPLAPPSVRSKSAPPPPPSSKRRPAVMAEEIEAEPILISSPKNETSDAELDDGPTVLRSSPLLAPPSVSKLPPLPSAPVATKPSASKPQVGSKPKAASKPISAAPPPPSLRSAPVSRAKLPPLPSPPPSLRSSPKPASQPKLPPPLPSSPVVEAATVPLPPVVEAETVPLPEAAVAEATPVSFAPAAQLAAPLSSRYVPPRPVPHSVRPLSALETIPASRLHSLSLSPQVLSQIPLPPQPAPRKSRVGVFAALGTALVLVGIAGAVVLSGVAIPALGGKSGSVAVTAIAPSNASLSGVRVLVDGVVRCETSPCQIGGLSQGTHFVSVEADGFAPTAARAVTIGRNGNANMDVELVTALPAAPKAEAKVAEPVAPVTAPTIDPVETDSKPAPAEPTRVASTKPAKTAAKAKAETKAETAKPAADAKKAEEPKKTASAAGAAEMGTLNINSIPVSNVVLDGRPVGSTPVMGLSVSAGPHSVVFIHPEHGRKASGATVKAGSTSTVAVRF